jgi:hypothetical protein
MQPSIARLEASIVLLLLGLSAALGGSTIADWLTGGAVFLSFLCTQSAFDLADVNEANGGPRAHTAHYRRLYIVKEALWIGSCIAIGNFPLITSTGIFAAYPAWRAITKSTRVTVLETA